MVEERKTGSHFCTTRSKRIGLGSFPGAAHDAACSRAFLRSGAWRKKDIARLPNAVTVVDDAGASTFRKIGTGLVVGTPEHECGRTRPVLDLGHDRL